MQFWRKLAGVVGHWLERATIAHFRRRLTFTAAACLLFVAAAPAQTPIDPAYWAPRDALAFVGVTDLEELLRQQQRSALHRLAQDQSLHKVLSEMSLPHRVLSGFRQRAAQVLGVEPAQLGNPFGASAAVFALAGEQGGEWRPDVVFVVGVRDYGLMRSHYQRLTDRLRQAYDRTSSIPVPGGSIERFERSAATDDAADAVERELAEIAGREGEDDTFGALVGRLFGDFWSAEELPASLAVCLTGDRFLIAGRPESLRAVLELSASDALAELPDYRRLRAGFGGSGMANEAEDASTPATRPAEPSVGVVRMFINVPRMLEGLTARGGVRARETVEMLGLGEARSIIGHAEWTTDDLEARYEFLWLLPEREHGLPKLLAMESREVSPEEGPAWRPVPLMRDTAVYARLNLNPAAAVDELEVMLRRGDPDAADALRADLEAAVLAPGASPLNLRETLIAKLAPPMEISLRFDRPLSPGGAHWLATIGCDDTAGVLRLLEGLTEALPGLVVQREIGSQTVYEVPPAGGALAVQGGTLRFGTTGAVEASLRSAADGAATTGAPGAFASLAAHCPPQAWGVLFVDAPRLHEAAVELAANRSAWQAAWMSRPLAWLGASAGEALVGGFDAESLPAARRVSRQRSAWMTTATTTAEGVHFVYVQLRVRE